MSTIIADNLTGKTAAGNVTVTSEGGAATFQLQQGLAKAWCRTDSTATALDSHNISSGTDNGTGDYTFSFTSSMNNDNFTGVCAGKANDNRVLLYSTVATGSIALDLFDADAGTRVDGGGGVGVLGDLA